MRPLATDTHDFPSIRREDCICVGKALAPADNFGMAIDTLAVF